MLAIICGALSSYLFFRSTTALLAALGTVDSPSLSQIQALIFDLNSLTDSLKSAVAAADKAALEPANKRADAFKSNLDVYAKVPGQADAAAQIGQQFDAYHKAAYRVVGILLEGQAGDVGDAAQAMQAAQAALDAHLKQRKDAAQQALNAHIDETRALAHKGFIASVAASLITLVLSIFVSVSVVRNLLRQLGGSPDEATRIVQRIASGNLSEAVSVHRDAQGSLLGAMKGMQEQLAHVIGDVHQAAHEVRHAADDIRQGNAALAERSSRQAANLQSSAASVDELTASVRHNADNAGQARELSKHAIHHADEGSQAVAHAVSAMGEVSERARKIVEITSLIDGIAFQTNILALNAAVEAARAGEQGRGFSVVAGEVRVLAQRAGAASKEIKALIEDAAERITVGAKHVNTAGEAMDGLVASVRQVGDLISEISVASSEQREGIELVNRSVSELDAATQENHAMVEQAGRAAQALQAVAMQLSEAVDQFQLQRSI